MKKEYKILGAGPAGLSAAIALAKASHTVHLHERYDCVGKRFQGDLQGLENWSTRDNVLNLFQSYGLHTDFEHTPFKEVVLTDGKKCFQSSSQTPLFYLVKRGTSEATLDTALCKQAIENGVNIHYQSSLSRKEADIVTTGPIRSAVIAADKGVIFSTKLPNIAVGIFHDELAYLGYSYLLVAEGYGCLCTVVFKDLHRLNRCFEKTIETAKRIYSLNLDDAKPVGGIGSFSMNHPLQIGSTLLAGEAAGFQDLLWGFGIRLAVTSGHLAAQSLIDHKKYEEKLKDWVEPSMQASVVNRFLWEKLKFGPRTLVPYLIKAPFDLRTNFRLLYQFTPMHRLLYPFAKRYIDKEYPHSISKEMSNDL